MGWTYPSCIEWFFSKGNFFRLGLLRKRFLGQEVDTEGRNVVSSIPSFVQLTAAGGDGAMWDIGVVEAAKIPGNHSESESSDGDRKQWCLAEL